MFSTFYYIAATLRACTRHEATDHTILIYLHQIHLVLPLTSKETAEFYQN